MSLALQAAEALAVTAHKDQMYGDKPYIYHLQYVVEVLKRFNISDENMLVAGLLHDVVEDTEVNVFQITAMFGSRVADLVHRVTNEEGKNRRERHEKTYPKIQADDDAITLKLADRIANIEHTLSTSDDDKLNMYTKEYKDFRNKLYKPGTHDAMWRHLDFLIGYNNNGKI